MRMRDLVRPTDPNRAALIERALKEVGDRRVEADFHEIVDLLRQEQLGNAARKQGKVNEDLEAILQLLLSEEYAKRIKDRQAEYRKFLQQLNIIIRDQGDIRGRTLSGDDPKPLSAEQHSLADRTGNLSQNIQKTQQKERGDAKDNSNGESKKNDNGDGKSQPGDGRSPTNPRTTRPANPTAVSPASPTARTPSKARPVKNPTAKAIKESPKPARRATAASRRANPNRLRGRKANRANRDKTKISSPISRSNSPRIRMLSSRTRIPCGSGSSGPKSTWSRPRSG